MQEALFLVITRAASYVLVAFGFVLVFGVGRLPNLAHGAMFLGGAYLAHGLARATLMPTWALVLTASVTVGAASWALAKLLLQRGFRDADWVMLCCVAASFLVVEVLRGTVGSAAILVPPIATGLVRIGETSVPAQQAAILALATLLIAGVVASQRCVPAMLELRAVAADPFAARVVGVDPNAALCRAFGIGGAAAAFAGCVVGPTTTLGPTSWTWPLTKSLVIAVMAQGSLVTGLVRAAILLAAVEVATALAVGEGAAELVGLVIVAVLVVIRPRRLVDAFDRM